MPDKSASVKLTGPLDEQGRKTGVWTSHHANGQLSEESTYLADQLDGQSKGWSVKGVPTFEQNFSAGKPNGVQIEYYASSQKLSKVNMLQGVHHGSYMTWFPDGTLCYDGLFHLGRQHGEWHGRAYSRAKSVFGKFAYGVQLTNQLRLNDVLPGGRFSVLLVLSVLGLIALAAFRDVSALTGFFALGIGLVVHEFGHWIAARLMGITVIEFRVGFGPRIFSFIFARTLFCVHLFPLVGWVREAQFFAGEEDHLRRVEAGEELDAAKDVEKITALPAEAAAPASRSVNRAKQIVFLAGGVLANFLVGFVALWVALGTSPLDAIDRSARVTTKIVSVVPEAVGEQLSTKSYTEDRPGLFRSSRDATKAGRPFSFHVAVFNLLLVAFNILPVPPLDGFRIVVCLIESVIRRPISPRLLNPLYQFGWLILMVLMLSGVFLLGRDFVQLLRGL